MGQSGLTWAYLVRPGPIWADLGRHGTSLDDMGRPWTTFPAASRPRFPRETWRQDLRHGHQLLDRIDGSQPPIFQRSLFGPVYVYNLLPAHVVASKSVRQFQGLLQRGVKNVQKRNLECWQSLLSNVPRSMSIASFQGAFSRQTGTIEV